MHLCQGNCAFTLCIYCIWGQVQSYCPLNIFHVLFQSLSLCAGIFSSPVLPETKMIIFTRRQSSRQNLKYILQIINRTGSIFRCICPASCGLTMLTLHWRRALFRQDFDIPRMCCSLFNNSDLLISSSCIVAWRPLDFFTSSVQDNKDIQLVYRRSYKANRSSVIIQPV